MRTIDHRYSDPLDRIWLRTAERIGLRVTRSGEVFASTDGRGGLLIGDAEALDPDDCLAQMVFHELCHSLVEGEDAFTRPDWGLDNTSPRDREREHACLRTQATLAGEYGLRGFLAPTTEFREFYDALAVDPLFARREASAVLATLAVGRADRWPWAPHLRAALEATATVARTAARFADFREAGSSLPSLWHTVTPAPERHAVGFPLAPDGAGNLTCGTCAWRYQGGRGHPVDRCRQAGSARVDPESPACNRWEADLECQECAACCRAAYHSVTISRRDPATKKHPGLVVDRDEYVELRRVDDPRGNRCVALVGGIYADPPVARERGWQPFSCTIYSDRPRPCREFERGGEHCLTARRRVGLSR